ncbi:MAG: NHLP leader peptide family RiPP precursor [Goleter apudmare HA4340-LM2]|jgi:hypothetical protein|nr:NHLP leader peptide family RiPP precursor [Goleter apudmare HA4340-LM2]
MTQSGSNLSNQELELFEEELKSRFGIESAIIAKAWADDNFRQELLNDPKRAIAQTFQLEIPDNIEVQVLEEPATTFYLTIPPKPFIGAGGELSDEQLEAVAGGWVKVAAQVAYSVYSGIKGCLGL